MKKVKLTQHDFNAVVKQFVSGETDCFPGFNASDEELKTWWNIYVGNYVKGVDKFISTVRKLNPQ